MSQTPRRVPHFEVLEPRRVMAAPAPTIVGTTMRVEGTTGADEFQFVATAGRAVRVNGVSYAVPTAVDRIVFDGGEGADSIAAWISGAAELRPGHARLFQPGRDVTIAGVEAIRVYGYGGHSVRFVDSTGADTFADRGEYARMFGVGYDNVALGFGTVTATSSGQAGDVAWFYNLAGPHVFSGRDTSSRSFSAGHEGTAFRFPVVYARGGEGDLAEVHGSAGDDRFVASPTEARLTGAGFYYAALGFDRVVGRGGSAGNDLAELWDSAGDDELVAWPIFTRLTGGGSSVEAKAFDVVHSRSAAGGTDTAWLYDGAGFDRFESTPQTSSLTGNGVRNVATGFELVVGRSTHGGGDAAELRDSPGADMLQRKDALVRLTGAGFDNRALGFLDVAVVADQGGADEAWLGLDYNSELYSRTSGMGSINGGGRSVSHMGVEQVHLPSPTAVLFTGPGAGGLPVSDDSMTISSSPIPPEPGFTVTYHEPGVGDPLALGSGVAHPWRVLADPADASRVLAITGDGEQGGPSYLYRMDAASLAPVGAPLGVGASASDFAWVGRYAVVAARNSSEIFLVDVDGWQIADRAAVFAEPISVAAIGGDRVAVVSVRVSELSIYRIDGGQLTLERTVTLPGIAYDVTYDAEFHRVYVTQPSRHTIAEVDLASGAVSREYAVGGEPSYGGVIMGRYYVATDRDGHLHVIERATRSAFRFDLAVALGLDRGNIAVRGIDPTDLIVLNNQRLAVVNNRQSSLLLEFDAQAAYQAPQVAARFAGAAFGAAVSATELLTTTPALNRIDRLTFAASGGGPTTAALEQQIVGVAPVRAVRLGTGPSATLAVLMSDHTLHLVSEFTGDRRSFRVINGYHITAWNPLAADDEGRLWLLVNAGTGRRLVALAPDGTLLADHDVAVASPYSMTAGHGLVLVVDRTNQRVLQLDAANGVATTIQLAHQRPRHAEVLAHNQWIVIHDTNPHIGVTQVQGGEATFTPYVGGRWLAGLTQDERGRAIALDFNGNVMHFDVSTRSFSPWLTVTTEPATTASYGQGRLWVVSPADSAVAIVRRGAAAPEAVWTDARATGVVPGDGGGWLITASGLSWRSLADPSWRL